MKRFLSPVFLLLMLGVACVSIAAPQPTAGGNGFVLEDPDPALSPRTGVVRRHWYAAARYLLAGAFSYVHGLDDPLQFPKQPGVSYPHEPRQVPTEQLEGLCRTLFAAVPLLKEEPGLELHGIRVADYYRHQIGRLLDPASPSFIKPRAPQGGPQQNLVEFGALAMALFAAPEILWDPLPQERKDALAAVMLSYGDGPTVPSNWKFFNVFILSFFKQQGYRVNDALLEDYVQKALADYRGEGWYNDNPAYDYYSMWAYQLYGMLWSRWFGAQHYPEYARRFTENFWALKDNYPLLFGRDARMIMWGRSISYRFAAVAPLPLMGFERRADVNYGWMRRIASGVLLQFLEHPKFMDKQVPTLGFYGPFEPAVQGYSCRGSVYWMGKLFFGLLVPADSPFWTAVENDGPWAGEFAPGTAVNTFLPASGLLITAYPEIGCSEVRAWCHETVAKDWQKFRSTENYNRLAYHGAFPWQADGGDGTVAMNYVVENADRHWEALRLFTFRGYEDGVYRREAVLETDARVHFDLADLPIANGVLRLDRLTAPQPLAVRFGHYALPQLDRPLRVSERAERGNRATILDNGEYQLALVSLGGWDDVEVRERTGLHPQAATSGVINGRHAYSPRDGAPHLFATLLLWKRAGVEWTNEELFSVETVTEQSDGSYAVLWRDGRRSVVRF